MRTDLVLDALRMALGTREPGADFRLVAHTDRGQQYTSAAYTQVLDDHRVLASVGSVGDAYDNAMAESFVDSFKTELIADRVWRTRAQLELAVVEYISWFNHDRLHESLGDIPPVEFEAVHHPERAYDPSGVVSALRCRTSTLTTRKPTNPVSVKPGPAQSVLEAHPGKSRGRTTTNCGLSAHRTNGLPNQRSPGTLVPEHRQPTTGPDATGSRMQFHAPTTITDPHSAIGRETTHYQTEQPALGLTASRT